MARRFIGNRSIIERAMPMATDMAINASWTLRKYRMFGSILYGAVCKIRVKGYCSVARHDIRYSGHIQAGDMIFNSGSSGDNGSLPLKDLAHLQQSYLR
jgi:hypothetical protein